MNPVEVDIRDILVDDDDTDFVFKENMFIARQPAEPINCVTLYGTSSAPPLTDLNVDTILQDSVEVLIRNNDYQAAHVWSQSIINALHGYSNTTKNGTLYMSILLQNGPNILTSKGTNSGKGQDNIELSLNFLIKRQLS